MALVDTAIMIDVLRQFPAALAWLASLDAEIIVVPGFVGMELLQECRNRAEQEKIERTLSRCRIVWPTTTSCDAALVAFAQFHLSHNLGLIDALIGQTAIELDLPLSTFNQKHYAMLTGLATMQPYSRATS
jgi:predicted nucleic acid-binding protein